jgi:hypothetical protein
MSEQAVSTDRATARRPGLWRRLADAFTGDQVAADLQRHTAAEGACPCDDAKPGEVVKLAGMLRSVSLMPRAGVPALEAELFDGTGAVTLIWLGRRRIVGIDPGRRMAATGRLAVLDGRRVIFNPRYKLMPTAADEVAK